MKVRYFGHITHSIRTAWKRYYRVIAGICMLGLVSSAYLACTEPGARLLLYGVSKLSPYQIEATEVTGKLVGPLSFKDLSIQGPNTSLYFETLSIEWQPLSLIKGKVQFKQLYAKNTKLVAKAPTNDVDTPIHVPTLEDVQSELSHILPISVGISNFYFENIDIELNEYHHRIHLINFSHFNSQHLNELKEFELNSSYGFIHAKMGTTQHVQWEFNLKRLNEFSPHLSGDLHTKGNIFLSPTTQDADHLNIQLNSQYLRLNRHQLTQTHFDLQGSSNAQLAQLKSVIDGRELSTHFASKIEGNEWKGQIESIRLTTPNQGTLPKSSGQITLKFQDTLQFDVDIDVLGNNPMHLNGEYSYNTKQSLQANMRGDITDFKILKNFFPSVSQLKGQAQYYINIQGPILSPKIWGEIEGKKISFHHAASASNATIQKIRLHSKGDGILKVKGHGNVGQGAFKINGASDFTGAKPQIDLHLKGNRLVLSNTPEYYLMVTPDIHLLLNNGQPQLTGTILVPEMDIHIKDPSNAIKPSDDVVVVSSKKAQKNKPKAVLKKQAEQPLMTDLHIELGDDIRFRGFGLTTELAGRIRILSDEQEDPKAYGKLQLINGKYRTWGKVLDIQYGQVLFSGGPITNPALDIRAKRDILPASVSLNSLDTPEKVTVGVALSGTLKDKKLKMFSNPSMPESDIISYLVLGRPQAKSSREKELIFEASHQLIGLISKNSNGEKLDLAQKLNLDTFGIINTPGSLDGSSKIEESMFVVGKQLSKNLYVQYGHGLLDSASSVSLRYLVGKHIQIEANTSNKSSSGNVLFTFESG